MWIPKSGKQQDYLIRKALSLIVCNGGKFTNVGATRKNDLASLKQIKRPYEQKIKSYNWREEILLFHKPIPEATCCDILITCGRKGTIKY